MHDSWLRRAAFSTGSPTAMLHLCGAEAVTCTAISAEEKYQELHETNLGIKGLKEQRSARGKLDTETTLCSDIMQRMACINFFSLAEVQLSLSASKLADGALQWLLFTINEKGLAEDRVKTW